MKKIIAIISAIVIAASMTACGTENGTNVTAETTAAETTSAETTSAETTAAETEESETEESETEATETEAAETEETDSEAEGEESEETEDVLANRADGLWMADLSNKVRQWPNNVKINISNEMDGIVTYVTMETLGEKYVSRVEVPDMLSSTTIYDGTNTYILDDIAKDYTIGLVNAGGVDAHLLAEEDVEKFIEAGVEEIDGTEYIYEEYDVMGIPTRYYFGEFGEIAYYSFEADGIKTLFTFTIDFADEADESVFAPPADYTEISYDDYKMKFTE